ncbi:hypothetical protein [Catenuloplanes niger]|uniref:Uncharacterized protein n=1 Tax=Catenuloplanes niger TaxID=587534 RepID=A0AAE3ZLR6_9ACTN|nr:hypothetical protein [Catenuloplanes niger]MDR7321024.1 hypothetical protein [Catenuloplanes niger]
MEKQVSGRPDPSGSDSAGEFTDALVALRVWAGKPSLRTLRDLARPAGALPTSTVHEILAGRRLPNLPRLEFVEAYVRTCLRVHGGAEPAETEAEVQRWRDAWRRLTSDRPYAIADGPPPVLARAPDPLPPVTVVTPEPLPAADPPPRTIVLAPPRRRSARMLAAAGLFLTGLLVGAVGVWFLPRDSGAPATAASGSAPPEVTCRTALPAPPDGPELISNGAFDRPLRRPWWTDSPKVELTAAGDALVAHVMGGDRERVGRRARPWWTRASRGHGLRAGVPDRGEHPGAGAGDGAGRRVTGGRADAGARRAGRAAAVPGGAAVRRRRRHRRR